MMIDTSLEAWTTAIKPDLAKKQQIIFDSIEKYPNLTAAEHAQKLIRPVNTISGRFGELNKLGKITRVERRCCKVTKGMAWTWRVI